MGDLVGSFVGDLVGAGDGGRLGGDVGCPSVYFKLEQGFGDVPTPISIVSGDPFVTLQACTYKF